MKRLVLITQPGFFGEGEPFLRKEAEIYTLLFEAGLEYLHVRKPEASSEVIGRLLEAVPSTYYNRIALHDHFEWAERLPLGGVHLNRRNPRVPEGFQGRVSRSCHSFEEVERWRTACDYLFLSPIFPSISKEGYGSGFEWEELRKAARRGVIEEKVIALGGMNDTTIPLIAGLPFGGYALLGAVWGNRLSVAEVVQRFNTYQKMIGYGN